MITDEIREELKRHQDVGYRDLQTALIPGIGAENAIGVRTPELRKMARTLAAREDIGLFLSSLPHALFEENQLHALIIAEMKDYPSCIDAVERFLPFIDNWATTDQMNPRSFRGHREDLARRIRRWTAAEETFTVRFGVKMMMDHFLGDAFDPRFPETAAAIRRDEYYIRTAVAWYFATALAKNYEEVLPYLAEGRLDPVTHRMTVRKACESRRISPERKAYLRTLRSGTRTE